MRARAALLVALALLLVLPPSRGEARRRFVPRQYRTLQAAINASDPGDTLWVKAGVYRGPFVIKKQLLLFGESGPDSTILDGGDSVRVLHVEGVTGGGIAGFGIRRGKSVGGGGIYCLRDTSFAIDYCSFDKNWASGVAAWECGTLKIADSKFADNNGSAVQMSQSTAFVLRTEFRRNKGNGGGAIYLYQSEIVAPLRGCLFEENRAEGSTGGAVEADSSRLTIADCTFARNSSAVAGGAVAAVNHSFISCSRLIFRENRAAQAGALHADSSQLLVGFSIFDRNVATAGGAAVAVLGRVDANVNQVFANNTFYKNATDGNGGTIFALRTSPEVRRNIFVVEGKSQLAFAGIQSSPLYECNLIHDPTGPIGDLPSSDTITGDPLFCDPAQGKFELRDWSPALAAACGPLGARPKGCNTFKLQPAR